ncbi:MAG: creatininase family protein [Planctomycetes bacterium]|nr:creatininase family protein [Planctomycetota bacterium]
MRTRKVLWQELRRTEFEQALKEDAVVIIPVGSTEQHGDHLPVNTDASQCFTIAQRAAQAITEFPVLVLPMIWSGYSPMHMTYPGAITLKYHTFIELLTEVAVAVHAHGFRKILFLNGHGGNESIIDSLRSKLACEEHVLSLGYTWWHIPQVAHEMKNLSQHDNGAIGHAGEIETSIQLYLQPELVDGDAAVWARGVAGDPSAGTREKGERLVDVAVDALSKILHDYHSDKRDLMRAKAVWEGGKHIKSAEDYYT